MRPQKPDTPLAFFGPKILWDGQLVTSKALVVKNSKVVDLFDIDSLPAKTKITSLPGGFLAAGFIDLQVNGGGGVLFNNSPAVDTLATISHTHARLGTTSFLPTLITDSPEQTTKAIRAVENAIQDRIPGVLGLHLEGPHIAATRKGAHLDSYVREMTERDLAVLLDAARRLPVLKVTLAPENTPISYVSKLVQAGIVVSLGHTDADFETCLAYQKAGATCVTHLFNAQSQMSGRAPGTVGAALSIGALSAGLIADGIHVDPAMIKLAMRAKQDPGEIFLVTDAMATVGSEIRSFCLNNREIMRAGDRLTLNDGTLAGAHVTMAEAVKVMVDKCDDTAETALKRATQFPADIVKAPKLGRLTKGVAASFVHLTDDLSLNSVWHAGRCIL